MNSNLNNKDNKKAEDLLDEGIQLNVNLSILGVRHCQGRGFSTTNVQNSTCRTRKNTRTSSPSHDQHRNIKKSLAQIT